jgi:hypothetical protein
VAEKVAFVITVATPATTVAAAVTTAVTAVTVRVTFMTVDHRWPHLKNGLLT